MAPEAVIGFANPAGTPCKLHSVLSSSVPLISLLTAPSPILHLRLSAGLCLTWCSVWSCIRGVYTVLFYECVPWNGISLKMAFWLWALSSAFSQWFTLLLSYELYKKKEALVPPLKYICCAALPSTAPGTPWVVKETGSLFCDLGYKGSGRCSPRSAFLQGAHPCVYFVCTTEQQKKKKKDL